MKTYTCGELVTAGRIEDEPWYPALQTVMEVLQGGCEGELYELMPFGLTTALEDCQEALKNHPTKYDDERVMRWIKSMWMSQQSIDYLKEYKA